MFYFYWKTLKKGMFRPEISLDLYETWIYLKVTRIIPVTIMQLWPDETKRQKVLDEKHARGAEARAHRRAMKSLKSRGLNFITACLITIIS